MNVSGFIALTVLFAASACNAVFGLDTRPGRSAEGGSSGGADACDGVCVLSAPAGWSGPTAVRTAADTNPLECGADLPNAELNLADDVSAAPASCTCACGDLQALDCSVAPVDVELFFDNNCGNQRDTVTITVANDCLDVSNGDSGRLVRSAPALGAAFCAGSVASTDMPDPEWASQLVGCGPVPSVPCGEQSCLAAPEGHSLCVFQEGDVPCPAGSFSEREVWFAGVTDSRACGACNCEVTSADCAHVVTGYHDGDCNLTQGEMVDAPGCLKPDIHYDSIRVTGVTPSGECTPVADMPTGEVLPASPTTVCCVPPVN